MNPHARASIAPTALALSIWRHRALIGQLAWRDITSKYRGSWLGIGWALITPIAMLAVYTFVFGTVFKARWGVNPDTFAQGHVGFALIMFVGLIVHGWLADLAGRAPTVITSAANYVKKVVFPLEILPVVAVLASSFHMLISLGVLLIGVTWTLGLPPTTLLLAPLIVIPLGIALAGISWALAALGVYLRDVGQSVGFIVLVLMFLSPVFYPVSALPPEWQSAVFANPLTFPMEQLRAVMLFGNGPDLTGLAAFWAGSLTCGWAGFALFQRTRQGFADVL